MSKVFKVWPKRVKRVNGTVLTPDMVIIVTTKTHVSNPFSNGAQEIKDTYTFNKMISMECDLPGIGKVKLTVGVRRRSFEKVQYCITAIESQ